MSWSTTGIELEMNSTDHIRQLLTGCGISMRDVGSSTADEPASFVATRNYRLGLLLDKCPLLAVAAGWKELMGDAHIREA